MSKRSEKEKFIVTWFSSEKTRLNFFGQLRLIKEWTEILIEADEFEMTAALVIERQKVVKTYLKEKRKGRTKKQVLMFYLIKIKRKLRNIL